MDYVSALKSAISAASTVSPERGSGCGRIYVIPSSEHKRGLKAAAKKLGVIWTDKTYGIGASSLYVGYDNCTGKELAKGTAMVAALKAHGIDCYRDEVAD